MSVYMKEEAREGIGQSILLPRITGAEACVPPSTLVQAVNAVPVGHGVLLGAGWTWHTWCLSKRLHTWLLV